METVGNNPFVNPSERRVNEIQARAAALLAQRTEDRFRELVLAWAAAQDGPFPTRARAEADARVELEVLCAGLGRWAALPPREVFPAGLVPAERLLPRDEDWW